MSKYLVSGDDLTSVADAIRNKTGNNESLKFPTEFVSEIGQLKILDTETKTVPADFSNGDMIITPSAGKDAMTQVTIEKPSTHIPENIKKDVIDAGITGTYAGGGEEEASAVLRIYNYGSVFECDQINEFYIDYNAMKDPKIAKLIILERERMIDYAVVDFGGPSIDYYSAYFGEWSIDKNSGILIYRCFDDIYDYANSAVFAVNIHSVEKH